MAEWFLYEVGGGHRLEGQLYRQSDPQTGIGVLLLHPYALLGGSMRDPVITELFSTLSRCPWISAVLRYNQRGVGSSTGMKQVRGNGDFQDVLDMTDHLANALPPAAHNRLVVIGYSWGCCVAAHALKHPLVAACVCISFPLGTMSAMLGARTHFHSLAETAHIPRLIVLGSQDQFTSASAISSGVLAGLGGQILEDDDSFGVKTRGPNVSRSADGMATSPLSLRLWSGADHFWMDERGAMAHYVVDWLKSILLATGNGTPSSPK